MEQEKINNILKQDIIGLKNAMVYNYNGIILLAREQERIRLETEKALQHLNIEIAAIKSMIDTNKKMEEERLRAKREWEEAIRVNGNGGGGDGGDGKTLEKWKEKWY